MTVDPTDRYTLRLVGIAGTTKVMAGELSRLVKRGLDRVRLPPPRAAGPGAIVYPFSPEVALIAARYHRTASRVLWDVMHSRAARLEPLYDDLVAAMRVEPPGQWYRDGAAISIHPRNLARFAAGARQVVGAVKNAIIDGARAHGATLTVDPDAPDVPLVVRMHDDVVTVSVDLAGGSTTRRGYRLDGGLAPLRENLAAVMVMLARHDSRSEPLVDPMAGSGTIAIEAALMARGAPLWVPPREPIAPRLPGLAGVTGLPTGPLFGDTRPLVVANDVDAAAVGRLRRAAELAGATDDVSAMTHDVRALTRDRIERAIRARGGAADRGVILCNPPYGERLGDTDVVDLYRALRRFCAGFRGWRAGFLVGHDDFEDAFGGRPRVVRPLRNAQLHTRFYLYDL